jgi:hypothetical protein
MTSVFTSFKFNHRSFLMGGAHPWVVFFLPVLQFLHGGFVFIYHEWLEGNEGFLWIL